MDTPEDSASFGREETRRLDGARSESPIALNETAERVARFYKDDFVTPRMLAGIWRGVEFVLLAGLGLLVFAFYVGVGNPANVSYVVSCLVGGAVGVAALELGHAYQLPFLKGSSFRYWRVIGIWGATIALVSLGLFFLFNTASYSRGWLGLWFVLGATALVVARLVLRFNIRRWARNGRMERRAVIVGGGKDAEILIRDLERQPESDIRICGIFDDRNDRRSPPIVAGYPKLGTVAELVEFARITRIDMLIVTLPLTAEARVLSLLKQLWILPIDIRLSAHSAQLRFRPRTYSFIGSVPLIDVYDRPLADWDWIAKRVFDVVFAATALVLLSPLLAVTAAAVKLDSPGPALFRQKRHGFNNQIVEVYKFRSLHHAMSDPTARQIVTRGDKRVTRVGRFIRRTSLDELPQLINVLKGDLSLVGPRPHAVHAISSANETFVEIVDGYFGRHRVKPGITGWAQIKGWRGEIDQPEKLKRRFEADLYYIENWSILLDIYILAMTPISLLRKEGAY